MPGVGGGDDRQRVRMGGLLSELGDARSAPTSMTMVVTMV